MREIQELFIVVMEDPSLDEEGIVGSGSPITGIMPLVVSRRDLIVKVMPRIRQIEAQVGRKAKILRFSEREDVTGEINLLAGR